MRIIKGTQDARRMKGIVQPGQRIIRCPCGAAAKPTGPSSAVYHCNKCGRNFTATKM